jgi:hypothetical protein
MNKIKENYYTGREVQQLLSITEPALRNLVNQKKIKKIIPPGRTNGVYLKTEINAFAAKWEAFLMAKEPPKATFRLARKEDMAAQEKLDAESIGPGGVSAEILQTWLNINGETAYHVSYADKLVAFAHLVPLREEVINQLLQNKIHWADIDPQKDIEQFETGKIINLYAYAIASDQTLGETTRQHYMFVLLRGIGEKLNELGKRGIIIKNVYGLSSTPTGIAMALHIGMKEYELLPRTGKTIRFIMEVDKSNSFLAKMYGEGLAKWNKTQETINRRNHHSTQPVETTGKE